MRGWWAYEILSGAWGSFAHLSKEESNTVVAITLIGVAIFGVLMLTGEAVFRHVNLRDDLDIHVGVLFSISLLAAFPIARAIFVRAFPGLSAIADENAEKRLKLESRR
jgi:hypothetical protein